MALGISAVIVHTLAWNELHNIKNQIDNQSGIQVVLKDYQSSNSVKVVNPITIKDICEGISELQYNGLFGGNELITNDNQAYSLIVYSKDLHVTFIISDSYKQSRVIGNNFSISVKNYENLYESLKSVFN